MIALRDSANSGVRYVATTGVPYPVGVVTTGAHAGRVRFDHWNQRIALSPPPRPVYLAELERAGALAS